MIVFVHGVPETAAVWNKVRDAISRESIALSLPGFGCPRPDGFGATKDDYVDWLLGELDAIGEPVDLVGHDWGAPLVFRIASIHPEKLRSWTADVAGLLHPDYEWHGFAQVWQTPGDGEDFIRNQAAQPVEEAAAGLALLGVTGADALELASGFDLTMGHCILDLYRSAVPNCHADWGPFAATSSPGLVLVATDDPFGDETKATEVAQTFGARVQRLEGAGHFWPYSMPTEAAEVLEAFWTSLER
jgi:pimeloyl-ACP methyl ester carboxylesterase